MPSKSKELKKWETGKLSRDEKLRAAYALNLCTVSVSQIIDYSDLNILEQEYEAILNNLNLENMPKDEPLLNIIKQILDTITFFRIQEGDKKFIERDYQQKMKDAIWSAVPNLSLIVAGGNPWAIAISLASTIGTGYMNYRKQKSQNTLEYEKQLWQLQRSAIEQFNGLRRELFDTAWRLSDKYDFPDEWRLSENQIKQYDDILMDSDIFRKQERLFNIRNNFEAYPQFWYYLGNATNAIAQYYLEQLIDEFYQGSQANYIQNVSFVADERKNRFNELKDAYESYRKAALSYFDEFQSKDSFNLLRCDIIAASAYLEYVDLLDFNTEREKIKELVDKAKTRAGEEKDILQLCAMDYLKIQDYDSAMEILRYLVIEDYNKVSNAQILSQLYVSEFIKNKSPDKSSELFVKHNLLTRYVNPRYLFPFPKQLSENDEEKELLNKGFCQIQRGILYEKFEEAFSAIVEKFTVQVNRRFQNSDFEKEHDDSYFLDDVEKWNERKYEVYKKLASKKSGEYLDYLSENNLGLVYVEDYIAPFVRSVRQIDELKDISLESIKENISNRTEKFDKLQEMISAENSMNDVTKGLTEVLFSLKFSDFVETWISECLEGIKSELEKCEALSDFMSIESELRQVCLENNIPEPEALFDNAQMKSESNNESLFDIHELLGEKASETKERERIKKLQIETLSEAKHDFDDKKLKLLVRGDEEFKLYFTKNRKKLGKTPEQEYRRGNVLAVLDDSSFSNCDLFFTAEGLLVLKNNNFAMKAYYSLFELSQDESKIQVQTGMGKNELPVYVTVYENKNCNMIRLKNLIGQLAAEGKPLEKENQHPVFANKSRTEEITPYLVAAAAIPVAGPVGIPAAVVAAGTVKKRQNKRR